MQTVLRTAKISKFKFSILLKKNNLLLKFNIPKKIVALLSVKRVSAILESSSHSLQRGGYVFTSPGVTLPEKFSKSNLRAAEKIVLELGQSIVQQVEREYKLELAKKHWNKLK